MVIGMRLESRSASVRNADRHRSEYALVPASACTRITQSFLDLERLSLGDVIFRQEYMCEFIAGPHTFLSQELLEAAIDTSVEPLFGGKLQWN
jgi:hypothetical protein